MCFVGAVLYTNGSFAWTELFLTAHVISDLRMNRLSKLHYLLSMELISGSHFSEQSQVRIFIRQGLSCITNRFSRWQIPKLILRKFEDITIVEVILYVRNFRDFIHCHCLLLEYRTFRQLVNEIVEFVGILDRGIEPVRFRQMLLIDDAYTVSKL